MLMYSLTAELALILLPPFWTLQTEESAAELNKWEVKCV